MGSESHEFLPDDPQPGPSWARRYWPRFVLAQLRFTFDALLHAREEAARARLRGQMAGLRALPRFLRKRLTRFAPDSTPELASTLTS